MVSTVVGLFFVLVAFWINDVPGPSDRTSAFAGNGQTSAPVDQPVEFTLTDELGSGEVSEQVVVLLNGKNIGNLTVDAAYPQTSMKVAEPAPGPYSYTVESTAIFLDGSNTVSYTGAGQGMINVQNGKVYSLRGSITGDTWFVSIEEED